MIQIGKAKHQLLVSIGSFAYLSPYQLTNLHYSPKSLKFVRAHLKQLLEAGYIRRLYLPHLTSRGAPLSVYTLDNEGYSYLKAFGLEPEGRFRASEQGEREWLFLRHTLAANDLLILAQNLARQDSSVQLVEFKTERQLKQSMSGAIPDGCVVIRKFWPEHGRSALHRIAFELDRATAGAKPFQKKVQALTQQVVSSPQTIAVVTTGSAHRLEDLVSWTETALDSIHARRLAPLFLFSAFDPDKVDPLEAFLKPRFLQPFGRMPIALLEPPS